MVGVRERISVCAGCRREVEWRGKDSLAHSPSQAQSVCVGAKVPQTVAQRALALLGLPLGAKVLLEILFYLPLRYSSTYPGRGARPSDGS